MRLAPRASPSSSAALVLFGAVLAQQQQQQSGEQKVLSPSVGDGAGSPFDADFGVFTEEVLHSWHVPGVAVAVVDGESTWAEGYGIANFPSSPVTPSTLFYTGSTTKAFTAAVTSLLIASGNFSSSQDSSPLGWQTPISHLIRDDFVLREGYEWAAAHLTLEDALSHRAGFARHDKALAKRSGPDGGRRSTVRDVARSLRHLPMALEPRVRWRYCNLMFMVVSHAIQTLTGRWLGTTMRELLWAPLGMNGTFLSVEEALGTPGVEVARGYYWDYLGVSGEGEEEGEGGAREKGGFVEVPFSSLEVASGAGGIVSNVLDYSRWIRCLMHEDECTVLPKEAHRELKAARIMLSPESRKGYDAPLAYALGWQLGTYKGHRVFTHGGGMEAHGAKVYFFPDLKYGVVTLANTAVTSNIAGMEVAWKLINDRLGVSEEERFDWGGSSKKTLDEMLKLADTAVEKLYPDRADPPLPRALPLQDYVGTYFHPAYRTVTIELAEGGDSSSSSGIEKKKKGELKAVRDNMEWEMTFEFQHVSGESWAVIIDFLNTPNMLNGQLARAEFVVGVKGTVDKLRMEFLEDGNEGIIVFDRM
ncbi:beta-lactamase/transpeptidase-like protein [Hypoxylon cercidicola]|nr:beta-lactamase/transpeptidase-like protein [Hypoxylon cercidicola]